MENLKITFFGTDVFSTIVLGELEKLGILPDEVVCAPDRPKGRGLIMTPPPAKVWAENRDVKVKQPEKLDDTFASDSNLFLVASYGKIIPQSVLDIPKHGTLNVHPSLLPKWRGASPIESQILNDDRDVGVTIMLVDAKMDHGPILDQEFVDVPYWPMKGSELRDLLAHIGGELLARVIPSWVDENLDTQEQEHELATFTKKINKEDALINLEDDAYQNLLKIRAYDVWPRAYFMDKNGKRVIVTEAEVEDDKLVLKRVIPEGKKEMDFKGF